MWVAGKVKLCDPMLTRAIHERLRDEQLIIKCYANEAYFILLYFIYQQTPGKMVDPDQTTGRPYIIMELSVWSRAVSVEW